MAFTGGFYWCLLQLCLCVCLFIVPSFLLPTILLSRPIIPSSLLCHLVGLYSFLCSVFFFFFFTPHPHGYDGSSGCHGKNFDYHPGWVDGVREMSFLRNKRKNIWKLWTLKWTENNGEKAFSATAQFMSRWMLREHSNSINTNLHKWMNWSPYIVMQRFTVIIQAFCTLRTS